MLCSLLFLYRALDGAHVDIAYNMIYRLYIVIANSYLFLNLYKLQVYLEKDLGIVLLVQEQLNR